MNRKILIVDDEPEFVDMIKMRLEANALDVIVAYDGTEGLEKAAQEAPDLILLDVMMPGMDGFAVLLKLKQVDRTAHIPVVMLTARGETKSLFAGQDLGSTDYLIKPCDSKELLSVIHRILGPPPP
jgi:DNA-binding response OmpR family regulator